MMQWISTKQILPLHVSPGDTLYVTYNDVDGNTHKLDGVQFEEPLIVDQISFFKVEGEYGFKAGIAAIVGEKL